MSRTSPIKASLYRPALWAGVERVPGILIVMSTIFMTLASVMLSIWWLGLFAAVFGIGGWKFLRMVAEYDPFFLKVLWQWLRRGADRYLAVSNGR
jgi:type IV secretory pathway TrbD component